MAYRVRYLYRSGEIGEWVLEKHKILNLFKLRPDGIESWGALLGGVSFLFSFDVLQFKS